MSKYGSIEEASGQSSVDAPKDDNPSSPLLGNGEAPRCYDTVSSSSSDVSIYSYKPFFEYSSVSEFSSTDDEKEMDRLLPVRRQIANLEDGWFGMSRTIQICFIVLGLSALLPWNFYITAESYWQYKFRNTTMDASTDYDYQYDYDTDVVDHTTIAKTYLQGLQTRLLAALCQSTNFIFLLLTAVFGRRYNIKYRVYLSLAFMTFVFMITTIFVKVDTDEYQFRFFVFSMAMATLLNCFSAIFQGSLFGLAGMFPPIHTGSLIQGQAIGGIFASLARITSLKMGADEITSAFYFFVIALIVMVIAIGCLALLFGSEMYRHYCLERPEINYTPEISQSSFIQVNHWQETKNVLKKIWPLSISVFAVFFITLSIFPAVSVHVESSYTNHVWKDIYFQPVITFLLFNVCDYLGRGGASWVQWPGKNSKFLPILVIMRVAFIPLMMVCNHEASGDIIPSIIKSDWIYGLIIIFFGLTNGYLGTLCMIYGPSSFEDPKDIERAGSIMAASLGAGLLGGALASFGFAGLYN